MNRQTTLPGVNKTRSSRRKYGDCLALVTHNQARIQQMRDLGLCWDEIAQHLKMSTTSLRQALHQLEKLESPAEKAPHITLAQPQEKVSSTPVPSESFKQWIRDKR